MPPCPIHRTGLRTDDRVALTFDDGPNPPRTEQVLEILARYDARATFFVFGKWAERYPESLRRVVAAGHLVGNHGYAGQRRPGEYDESEAAIAHVTGRPTDFVRAHQFDYETMYQSSVAHLPETRAIDSDVRSMDWLADDVDAIVERVLDNPELGPGSIIALHDGAEMDEATERLTRPLAMLAALPRIIAGLQERGLRSVRVDELQLAAPLVWSPEEGLIDPAELTDDATPTMARE